MTRINHLREPSAVEALFYGETDPDLISLFSAGSSSAWWTAEKGVIQGILNPAADFKWKDIAGRSILRSPAGKKPPGYGFDNALGAGYLKFGYGNNLRGQSLARETLTCVYHVIAAAGSGYVNGEEITFNGGVKLRYTGSTGTLSVSNTSVISYGSFGSMPTTALAQTSTTGSGSGAVLMPSFAADNGSLECTPDPALFANPGAWSALCAYRIPVVGGAAGDYPGGFMFGGQLNQGEISYGGGAGNTLWWGLRGGGRNVTQLQAYSRGDSRKLLASSGLDIRDSVVHVDMMTIPVNSGDTATLWHDGSLLSVTQSGAFALLSTVTGVNNLRVGAAGLPSTGPTSGFAGDIFSVVFVPLDLSLTANATLRQKIYNKLLGKYKPGTVAS